jgi:glycopeptide antibiotics resistance protein
LVARNGQDARSIQLLPQARALLAPSRPWWKLTGPLAGTSLVLEALQFGLAVGRSDIADVVANTAGGLIGLGLFGLARHRFRDGTGAVMTWVCATGTVLSLVLAGLFVASPIRYGP